MEILLGIALGMFFFRMDKVLRYQTYLAPKEEKSKDANPQIQIKNEMQAHKYKQSEKHVTNT